MMVTGDLKCLHCGYITGQWMGQGGAPLLDTGLKQHAEEPAGALVHCSRCDGPVFLDDVSPVVSSSRLRRIRRLREQIAALDQNRAA